MRLRYRFHRELPASVDEWFFAVDERFKRLINSILNVVCTVIACCV